MRFSRLPHWAVITCLSMPARRTAACAACTHLAGDLRRGFREKRQGMDHVARVHEPAGRSPAGGEGHPHAEGRARLPRRHAEEAHQDRRGAGATTGRSRRRRHASASPRSARPTKAATSPWSTSPTEATLKNLRRTRPAWRASPTRAGSPTRTPDASSPTTPPIYHLMAGLHSGETGPPEMLMELAYRLVAEDSPLFRQIRDNIIVSFTPASEPGRPRPLRRLVPPAHGGHRRGEGPHPRPAVLGQVHLSRQQSRHQLLAGDDAQRISSGT